MSQPARELSWVTDGQRVFEQTRQMEGLCRPPTWAQTGIETPMLPGGELIAFQTRTQRAGAGDGSSHRLRCNSWPAG
ncbi:MAG: hypothetical protein WCC65_04040 [Pseudonocardiaceae bacterium]